MQGTKNAKTILKIKSKVGGLSLPDFKTNFKSTIKKLVHCQHKYKCIVQWNKIESPEINPYIYGQFISDKGTKTIQW